MEKDSFMYTISSEEAFSYNLDSSEWIFELGGFSSSPFNHFKIEVVNCIFDNGLNPENGYIMLIARDLAENGYFCRSLLPANEAIVCTVGCNDDVYLSNGGTAFNAKNLRMKRQILFKVLLSTFETPVHEVNINVDGITNWLLTLKVTPIKATQ